MAVYYNKEKGIHGSLTGSIISFPIEVKDNDPASAASKALLPAGYLRCDGRVLTATEYPLLAVVLGVGDDSKYQKSDQALSNSQFQLPDLRSKHIRATTSANIGRYNDLEVTDANNNVVLKSGVGLSVIANITSPYEINYQGSFYIPPQTTDLRGEPRFALETGAYTFTTEVPQNAFQPHMHRSETLRARQEDSNGNYFSGRQRNSVRTKSSMNVCQWWWNTQQPLCYWAYTGKIETKSQTGTVYGPGDSQINNVKITQWGLCWSGCNSFVSAGYCLWPDETTCSEIVPFNKSEWNVTQNVTGDPGDCNRGDNNEGVITYFGNNIDHSGVGPTWTQDCNCATIPILGCVGGDNGLDWDPKPNNYAGPPQQTTLNTKILETDLGGDKNLPFGPFDELYTTSFGAASNVTTLTGMWGNEAEHRHRIDLDPDAHPHTFKMVTRAATARADSGLKSTVSFTTNTDPKADKYIQPYIITEYLIKI